MFNTPLRPGQGAMRFKHLKSTSGLSSTGRAGCSSTYEVKGEILGILSETTPKEIERWGTTEKPISHKIVQHGGIHKAAADDILKLVEKVVEKVEKQEVVKEVVRYFYIQRRPRNPGNLGHFTVYFCEERSGLNE